MSEETKKVVIDKKVEEKKEEDKKEEKKEEITLAKALVKSHSTGQEQRHRLQGTP